MRKTKNKNKGKVVEVDATEVTAVEDKADDSLQDHQEEVELVESEPETKKRKSDKRKSARSKIPQKQEESSEESNYEVEAVLDEKIIRGVRHYLIRWKGYEAESDSWEPESTLKCEEIIKEFKSSQNKNGENGNALESLKKNKRSKLSENVKTKKNKKDFNKEKKSKNISSTEEVDWDSNDEFEVDRILDVYFKKNGQREFLVSWKGYPSAQASWEPEENLECSDLIQKFMIKVEAAKQIETRELRVNPSKTERLTLRMYEGRNRRLSRRLNGKQRIQYCDAE